jgi:hypothetical protein
VAAQNNFTSSYVSIFIHKRIISLSRTLNLHRELFTFLGYGSVSTREPL